MATCFGPPETRTSPVRKPGVGFQEHEEFALFRSEEYEPFAWLVSLTDPSLEFAIAPPELFLTESYHLNLGEADQHLLGLEDEDPIEVFLIVSPCAVGRTLTANLRGPVVVNWRTRLAKQLLLYSSRFSARQPVCLLRDQWAGIRSESFRTEVRVTSRKAA